MGYLWNQWLIQKVFSEEVSVFWDDQLIPHIVAQNEHDMFFAQGYVEASLRLWQMEFTIFAAAGRLSEILGDDS